MQLAGLGDGVVLLARVNDEQSAGELLHFLDAAEILLELLHLAEQLHDFLLREHIEGAVLLHLLELSQTVDAGAHGLEVGEHAAEPTGVDVVHTDAGSLFLHSVSSLLFRADEEDGLAILSEVAHEAVSLLELFDGLLQVDDVDTVALAVDILRHFRVPSAGLVTEVDTGLKKLFHRYDCHSFLFPPLISCYLRELLLCPTRPKPHGRTSTPVRNALVLYQRKPANARGFGRFFAFFACAQR